MSDKNSKAVEDMRRIAEKALAELESSPTSLLGSSTGCSRCNKPNTTGLWPTKRRAEWVCLDCLAEDLDQKLKMIGGRPCYVDSNNRSLGPVFDKFDQYMEV